MNLSKRAIALILINPLLLGLQFMLGYVVYQNVFAVNEYHKDEITERASIRRRLFKVIDCETNQRGYLLCQKECFLENFSQDSSFLSTQVLPLHADTDRVVIAMNGLIQQYIGNLSANISSYRKGETDFLEATFRTRNMRDSIQMLNNFYFDKLRAEYAAIEIKEQKYIGLLTALFTLIFIFNLVFAWFSYQNIRKEIISLSRLNQQLEYTNSQLERFVYMASHHLKEPLRSIAGFLQLLQKKYAGSLDEQAQEYINESVAATKKMEQTITELRRNIHDKKV